MHWKNRLNVTNWKEKGDYRLEGIEKNCEPIHEFIRFAIIFIEGQPINKENCAGISKIRKLTIIIEYRNDLYKGDYK